MQTSRRPSPKRSDRARQRLRAVTSDDTRALENPSLENPALENPAPETPAPETPAPEPDLVPAPPAHHPEPGLARPRGPRERWLPSSWRGARADPGRRGALTLAGVAAVAAVLAAVGVWRDRPVPQPVPALAPVVASAPVASSAGAAATGTLVVSVAGSVLTPGLVTLPAGARVADALTAAGGALPGTDLLTLNPAEPLRDGQQVLVGVPGAPPVGSSGATVVGGLVNLNTATATELEELPGVGPVMAQAIIDFRTENGPFTSVDQLDDVSGVGAARLAQLRDRTTV